MVGVAGLSPLSVTLVSRIRLPFLNSQLIFAVVALDGAMIAFSMIALNVFHPCRLLGDERTIQEEKKNSVTDA